MHPTSELEYTGIRIHLKNLHARRALRSWKRGSAIVKNIKLNH